MKLVGATILIGGAPCAGKSTVAKVLAAELGVTWVSTDDVRVDFSKQADQSKRQRYPWIFSSVNVTAEEFWKNRTPADVMQVEIEQGREFWSTLKPQILSGTHPIIEGVSIIPECLHELPAQEFRSVFLIDTDRDRVRQSIQERGLWAEANTYADWIKPLELEWVMMHNEWFRIECQKYAFPCLEAGDRSTLLSRVHQALRL